MILTFMTATLVLSVALMVLNYLIGANQIMSREKASIFECGFDPSTASRLPFSMHFFLVALIFLIFDVEISLLVPLPLIWSKVSHSMLLWVASGVLALLLVGALVEWVEGSLEWQA